ncbi:hypothetical protein H181DRAFT_03145 [Streptomyces sp. WMMB 714]|uniref:hypothetical protein n=1 Tax=Streptomyces sp. WMMB 714 TaxID=1286822 RepID=UPI0005F808D2|nr:hypothetical protein [Streptomyces sp. WMMB 714]SCK37210.1 hypothetical protein H181DRAFT_03145 [Streptomyces sp. WMMB 714]
MTESLEAAWAAVLAGEPDPESTEEEAAAALQQWGRPCTAHVLSAVIRWERTPCQGQGSAVDHLRWTLRALRGLRDAGRVEMTPRPQRDPWEGCCALWRLTP